MWTPWSELHVSFRIGRTVRMFELSIRAISATLVFVVPVIDWKGLVWFVGV